jgi:hypothetical protein
MDLSTLFATGEGTIELKHPVTGKVLLDDNKKPFSLTVIGTHTAKYKEIARKIGFLAHKRNKDIVVEDMSFDEFNEAVNSNELNELELLAQAITSCNITLDGAKIKCTPEKMIELLSDERFAWIKDQYVAEVKKGKVFFGK